MRQPDLAAHGLEQHRLTAAEPVAKLDDAARARRRRASARSSVSFRMRSPTVSVTSSPDVSAIMSPSSVSPSSPVGRCSEMVCRRVYGVGTSATLSLASLATSSSLGAAQLGLQRAAGAIDLADAIVDVHRNPDRAALVRDRALHGLPDHQVA